jgi:tRNA uridine 5-carbamoylmethylation protein Kti12
MEDTMKLTIEEKQHIQKIQDDIKSALASLGSTRRQFVKTEGKLTAHIDKLEEDFMTYLKVVAKNKGMTDEEDWVFDPNEYGFIKR